MCDEQLRSNLFYNFSACFFIAQNTFERKDEREREREREREFLSAPFRRQLLFVFRLRRLRQTLTQLAIFRVLGDFFYLAKFKFFYKSFNVAKFVKICTILFKILGDILNFQATFCFIFLVLSFLISALLDNFVRLDSRTRSKKLKDTVFEMKNRRLMRL